MLDAIAAILSFLCVFYMARQQRKGWWIGIVAACLNSFLYWNQGIFADACLEGYYFLTFVYGLWVWQVKSDSKPLVPVQNGLVGLFFMVGFISIYEILTHFSTSTIPILDALTVSLSVIAQWLLCMRKKIAWLMWIVTDCIYAFLYYQQGLPFHTVLMFAYVCLAVYGYYHWKSLEVNSAELNIA